MSRRVALLWSLISAAVGALGTVQTLLEVGSGQTFELQLLGFWLGASAIAVYIAACIGAIAGGILSLVLGAMASSPAAKKSLELGAFIIGGLVGILAAATVVLQGVLFDYEGTDAIGRGFLALLGVAAIAVGVWAFRRLGASRRAMPPAA